jgi:hypothetical protein
MEMNLSWNDESSATRSALDSIRARRKLWTAGKRVTEDHKLSAVNKGIRRHAGDGYWCCEQVNNPLNSLNGTGPWADRIRTTKTR